MTDSDGKPFNACVNDLPLNGALIVRDQRSKVRVIWETHGPIGRLYLCLRYAAPFIWFGKNERLARIIESVFDSSGVVPSEVPELDSNP